MGRVSINEAITSGLRELQAGQLERAAWIFNQVVEQQPREPNAIHYLGLIAFQRGNIDEALRLVRRSIELAPSAAPFYCNLGKILREKGDIAGAIAAYQQALDLNPNLAEAKQNLAVAHKLAGETDRNAQRPPTFSTTPISQSQDDATLAARYRAVEEKPDDPETHFALAALLHYRGELAAAAASYQRAIALRPEMGAAHVHRGQCLLAMGNFEQGWPEYLWPSKSNDASRPQYPQPAWDGSDLSGRRILLYYEQGFGDTIQFIRYAPLVAERGGHVIVRCQPQLRTLVESVAGVAQVICGDDPLPEFDTHQSLLNLPLILRTTLQNIPNRVPYLRAPSSKLEFWRQRLPKSEPDRKRAGLVWAGHPHNLGDQLRTVALAALAPLFAVSGTAWISLQKGVAAEQLRELPDPSRVTDLGRELRDFADTAAILEQLDLLITVDTSAAHLAGALGRPVWMLTPFVSDWRWFTDRSDSPWYPTLRLFRQFKPGDWGDVVASVARALADLPASICSS